MAINFSDATNQVPDWLKQYLQTQNTQTSQSSLLSNLQNVSDNVQGQQPVGQSFLDKLQSPQQDFSTPVVKQFGQDFNTTTPTQDEAARSVQSVDAQASPVTPLQATTQAPIVIPSSDTAPQETVPKGLVNLLQNHAPAAAEAVSSADDSKGLISRLSDDISQKFSGAKDYLKGLSPEGSQALLASGLSILANNNGQSNFYQLIGKGGAVGVDTYNAGIQQKQAQAQQEQQNIIASRKVELAAQEEARKTALDAQKAILEANKPISVGEGQTLYGRNAAGTLVPLTSQQTKIERVIDIQDPSTGEIYQQGVDRIGNPVGPRSLKTAIDVGPLSASQQEIVNKANEQAAASKTLYDKYQGYASKLEPTIPDPANPGKSIPNPNYVPITGGTLGNVSAYLNSFTGSQSEGERFKQEVLSNVRSGALAQYKGLGAFSDRDAATLEKGLPPQGSSNETLKAWLDSAVKLQQAKALVDERAAAHLTANRGSTAPLTRDTIIGGTLYPAGSTYSQTQSGKPVQAPVGQNIPAASGFSLDALRTEQARRKAAQQG